MEIKMMNNLKQKLGKSIENRRDELTAMADKIFDLSEVSGEEYHPQNFFAAILKKKDLRWKEERDFLQRFVLNGETEAEVL
jgi:metal-dependent amidase/aminoacylase/carboxypeptidase family protein